MTSPLSTNLQGCFDQISQSIVNCENTDGISLQAALEKMEKLAIIAADSNRNGFMDTCLLVQEKFNEIVEKDGKLNEDQFHELVNWTRLAADYLQQSNAETASALTGFFTLSELYTDLEPEHLHILREMLASECQSSEPENQSASGGPTAQHEYAANDVLNDLQQTIARLPADINKKQAPGLLCACNTLLQQLTNIRKQNTPLSKKQVKLLYHWHTNTENYISGISTNDPIHSLAQILSAKSWPCRLSHEQTANLKLLSGLDTVTPLAPSHHDDLQQALAELTEAFSNYDINNKQSLAQVAHCSEQLGLAAGNHGLPGFQDVCLIVSQCIEDLAGTDGDGSSVDFIHLARWLILASAYLQENISAGTIEDILDYIANKQWPTPAEQDDLEILREMLTAESSLASADTADAEFSHDAPTVVIQPEPVNAAEEPHGVIDTSDTLAAPHTVSVELVEMLKEEMNSMSEEFISQLEDEQKLNVTFGNNHLISDLSTRIERFASACQAAEMDGLHQACLLFSNNLKKISSHTAALSPALLSLVKSFPAVIIVYLNKPGDADAIHAVLSTLQNENLPKPLLGGVAPALQDLLEAVYISEQAALSEPRKQTVDADDVSIRLPDDINQELLDGLLLELPQQANALSNAIQSLIDGSQDLSVIQQAQRVAHTIKGSANTVGVQGVAMLTHQLEDILGALSKHEKIPGQALLTAMIEATDCLEEMTEALHTRSQAPAQSLEIAQSMLDWFNRIETDGIDCVAVDADETKSDSPPSSTTPEPRTEAQPLDDNESILHIPASLLDKVLRLMGESVIINSQIQEKIRTTGLDAANLIDHQGMVQELVSELEIQVEVNNSAATTNHISIKNEGFDALEFNEYNELHTVTNRISEAAVDSVEMNRKLSDNFTDIGELIHIKQRLQQDIQDLILRARMVPVSGIIPRLQRIVRQASRATNKQVSLQVEGSETLMDSDILNNLLDPLMHILRNAIDHGLESAEQRTQLNKPAQGNLKLVFARIGGQVVISCKDDGMGLNREKIRATAIEKGIIDEQQALSDSELYRLILSPGFSTSSKVTQTSGRGIGMDVVNTEIQKIKGSINIESSEGEGCSIELSVPLTLTTVHAILVKLHNHTLALSNHTVERILHPGDYSLTDSGPEVRASIDGEEVGFSAIESLLQMDSPAGSDDLNARNRVALLVNADNQKYIISVEQIIDTRDLFVKSMGKYLNNVNGVIGATILGNGCVVPVIDLPELLRTPVTIRDDTSEYTRTDIHQTLPTALVVDDSLSARRALSQVVKDAGYAVIEAKDGLEAVEMIQNRKPDILLVDMEMPRMNGIELTSHFRGSSDLQSIPVIMITSRTTDKHRTRALSSGVDIYLTKPFSEDQLIDHVQALLQQSGEYRTDSQFNREH